MAKIIKLTIADEYIEGSGVSIGAAGSHDEVLLECHFSDLWKDTTKRVFWRNALGEDAAVTIVTPLMDVDGNGNIYQVPVAPEAKTYSGEAGVTIKGVKIDAETGVETEAVVTETAYFRVLQAYCGVPETADVTPSQAEQLQAEIDEIKADADKVEEDITAIEEDIAAIEEDIAAIEEDIAAIEEDIAKIKETPGVATVSGSLTSKDENGMLRGTVELTYDEIMELINDGKTVMLSVIDRTREPARTYMAHYDGNVSANFSSILTEPVAVFFFYSGVFGLLQTFIVGKTGDITCTETFHYTVPKGTSEDEGKFLRCSDTGSPEWQTVESAEGVGF